MSKFGRIPTRSRKTKYIELTAIKGLIREKKSSYEKLGKALGVSPNTVSNKINGYQLFDTVEIDTIADQLDIDAEKINHYFFPHLLSGATIKEYMAMHNVV